MQAHQSKHCIGGSTRRERDVCAFFLNFVSLFFCFYSGNSSSYFKVLCRSLQKKSDRTRCLALSILEWNSTWAERAKAFWFSEGRTK